jgi:hypothetical protein
MSGRQREVRVRLDGLMSEAQIGIVRDIVFGQLVSQADDLSLLNQYRDPKKAIREVAALGRLAFWLEYYGEIVVPDGFARRLMQRTAREIDETNQSAESTGDGDPEAEHDAMRTFVGLFSDWPAGAEVHDIRWQREHSTELKAGGSK